MSPASPREEKNALCSEAASESTGVDENQDLNSIFGQASPEQASSTAAPEGAVRSGSLANTSALKDFPETEAGTKNSPTAELSRADGRSSELSRTACFPSERDTKQLPGPSTHRAAECAQTAAPQLEGFCFPNPYAREQEGQNMGKSLADSDVERGSFQSYAAASGSPAVCSPAQGLSRRKSSDQDEQGTVSQTGVSGESSGAAGGSERGLDDPVAAARSELRGRRQLPAAEAQERLPGDPSENTDCPGRGESGWLPRVDGLGAQAGVESGRQCRPVKMSLYVHCIKGLVLCLLAEDHLREDQSSAEDVVSGKAPRHLQTRSLLLVWWWGRGSQVKSRCWIALPIPLLTCKAKPFGSGFVAEAAWEVVRERQAASPRGESIVSQATPVACCCLSVPAPEQNV